MGKAHCAHKGARRLVFLEWREPGGEQLERSKCGSHGGPLASGMGLNPSIKGRDDRRIILHFKRFSPRCKIIRLNSVQ